MAWLTGYKKILTIKDLSEDPFLNKFCQTVSKNLSLHSFLIKPLPQRHILEILGKARVKLGLYSRFNYDIL